MIYECLLVPTETATSLSEIKRALLTYDKVKLIDPSDRDLMPSNTYLSTIIGMPLFSMNIGPVRPMGKVAGYDDKFERTIDELNSGIRQGLIEVVSTYNIPETSNNLIIGAVPNGGYPLNPQFVFGLYRSMAQNQEFLADSLNRSKKFWVDDEQLSNSLSLDGVGDGGINDIPALPLLEDGSLTKYEQEALSKIARARIASMIKFSGYCEAKQLIPIFDSSVYGAIVSRLLNNAHCVFNNIENDSFWLKRNRILELCHEEFLDESQLDAMSIDDIIKLRTKAWGKQAKSREVLFETIANISLELEENIPFQAKAKEFIKQYRIDSENLINERKDLHFKIKCEFGKAALIGGTAFSGLLSQLSSPSTSMAVTLAAGGAWAFDKSKKYEVKNDIKKKDDCGNCTLMVSSVVERVGGD